MIRNKTYLEAMSTGPALEIIIDHLRVTGPHSTEVERAIRCLEKRADALRIRREARRSWRAQFPALRSVPSVPSVPSV